MTQQTLVSENKWSWIDISRGERSLQFASPGTQPGDFLDVTEMLKLEGLTPPTFADLALLVAEALTFPSDPRFDIFLEVMRERWLWVDTAALYLPERGVYIQDFPIPTKDGRTLREDPFPKGLWMDPEELQKRLDCGDPNVRFVPFGFKVGFMDFGALAKNELFIALCGDAETANSLAVSADRLQRDPCLSAFDRVDRPYLKVAMMGMDLHGEELVVGAKGFDIGPNGNGMCAFGLHPA